MPKGSAPLAILMMGMPLILLQTFRHMPTGGVMRPIARPMMKMPPNCQSLMPRPRMMGSRMGVSIKIAGETSMNVPRKRISRSKITRLTQRGRFSERNIPATVCGTCCMVISQVKIVENPMMIVMLAVEISVLRRLRMTALRVSFRYTTKPRISE